MLPFLKSAMAPHKVSCNSSPRKARPIIAQMRIASPNENRIAEAFGVQSAAARAGHVSSELQFIRC